MDKPPHNYANIWIDFVLQIESAFKHNLCHELCNICTYMINKELMFRNNCYSNYYEAGVDELNLLS